MGFRTGWLGKRKTMPEYGMIGTDGYFDSVTGEHDIDWVVVSRAQAMELLAGIGESRGYKIVNGIMYHLVYLPSPPHLQQYEA